MILRRSLTFRLITRLFVMQALAFVVAWFLTNMLADDGLLGANGFSLLDTFTYYRIRDLLMDSVVRAPDGSLRLEPVPALRSEIARTPALQFVVFESMKQEPLPGSSPQLAADLRRISGLELRGMDFLFPDNSGTKRAGSIWQWTTDFGPMFIGASGYAPHWFDIPHALRNSAVSIGINLLAVFSVSVVVAWIVVRNGLSPLREAAAAAERLDLDSLGQGVSAEGAPIEVAPLIDAINRALKRLDAAATRMRRYTANAAHELRTPVAILRARLQNPEEKSFKADLERDARRIQGVVEQMLMSARLNERQASLDNPVDLVEASRRIVADYSPLVYRAQRRIAFEAEDGPVVVKGNRQALESIIANLIDNALRAEKEGGTVIVRVVEPATIEVIDHGDGVAESDREMIFEPFWRKAESRTGAGLGLAIAKELVELHGGRMSVDTTLGGGATFRLVFPAAPGTSPDLGKHG